MKLRAVLILALMALSFPSCEVEAQPSADRNPKVPESAKVPDTISPEARAFLVRSKGDIIKNYLLDENGSYVLPNIHRTAAPDMRIEEVEINGVKAFWVSSEKASAKSAVVVYMHGGGFVEGSGDADGGIIFPVFEELGVRGLSVDYRLAPEHPFPAAVEDTKNVFLGLLDDGYRADQIALMGDSAGGTLALAATLALEQDGKPLPAAIAVISTATDLNVFGDSFITLSNFDPFSKLEAVRVNATKYAGSARRDDPLVSPLYGDFKGFPPLLIQVGTRDFLLSDSVRLARRARTAGVDVTLDVWEGMWHAWHMTWPEVPEAREACREAALFLAKHLAQENP